MKLKLKSWHPLQRLKHSLHILSIYKGNDITPPLYTTVYLSPYSFSLCTGYGAATSDDDSGCGIDGGSGT